MVQLLDSKSDFKSNSILLHFTLCNKVFQVFRTKSKKKVGYILVLHGMYLPCLLPIVNITLSCTAYSKRSENIFWRIGAKNITENAEKMDTSSLYVSRSVLRYTNLNAADSEDDIECWFLPEDGEEKTTKITLAVLGESFKIVPVLLML